MIHFSLLAYLTVHKRNEQICPKDMLTKLPFFVLIDMNLNNNIKKISLKIPLII